MEKFEINERFRLVMDYYNYSSAGKYNSSRFADDIGNSRSAVSQIVSGKRRPSATILAQLYSAFPDINKLWLENGVGEMTTQQNNTIELRQRDGDKTADSSLKNTLFDNLDEPKTEPKNTQNDFSSYQNPQSIARNETIPPAMQQAVPQAGAAAVKEKTITKIVVFYSDNTFAEFIQQ